MTCASHRTMVNYFMAERISLCHFRYCVHFHHTKNELYCVKKHLCVIYYSEVDLNPIVVGKEKYRNIGNHVKDIHIRLIVPLRMAMLSSVNCHQQKNDDMVRKFFYLYVSFSLLQNRQSQIR